MCILCNLSSSSDRYPSEAMAARTLPFPISWSPPPLVSLSPFPVGCCSWLGVAVFGWVVPLCCLAASGGVGGRFGGCGLFSRLFPLPPPVFFWGGGLPVLPSAFPGLVQAEHWPGFSVVFRAAVFSCVLFGRVPAPWVGWAMYTVGSAPLVAGLGPGSAGLAAASGGCLWFWVRGLGLFVSFPLCGAGLNLLGGPPTLLPGALWPRVWPAVLVCGVLVRRLRRCAVSGFG